ncbi:MAG TPA: YbhB/YbcL family Raf kinase inhibitor-like protein [Caulobacteraceae bacterium]|nr:YbhB/YbcL family Raf kinase inhibitor-like protein [Caulobacteraceae bacterium]
MSASGQHAAVTLGHIRPVQPAARIDMVSDALGADGSMDLRHTAYGDNLSPPLRWTPVEGARAYAIVLEDPDAPKATPFVHWLIWNIPSTEISLPEGLPTRAKLSDPPGAAQGRNDDGGTGYFGPRPPAGSGVHHYHFQIFALDGPLALAPGANLPDLTAALQGHVLADGELVGTFEAPKGH